MLGDLLRKRKTAIGKRWFELTLGSYRPDAASFLQAQNDRFANPVGQTLATGTEAILDELLDGADPAVLCTHLEEIIKIRAIQDFTPAQAVGFVFLLKEAIREEVLGEMAQPGVLAELQGYDVRIDQMALYAFDIFVRCREQVYSLRVNEIRKGYVQPE